jgi:hypothetical protein
VVRRPGQEPWSLLVAILDQQPWSLRVAILDQEPWSLRVAILDQETRSPRPSVESLTVVGAELDHLVAAVDSSRPSA